jgi:hypothetical protein
MALPKNMKTALSESTDDRRLLDYSWWVSEIYHWNLQAQIGNPGVFASGDLQQNLRTLASNYTYNPNLLKDYYVVATSRLAVLTPTATVQPATPATDDVSKAIASQEALNYFWWDAEVSSVWEGCVKSLLVQGNAGLHVYWDQSKGNKKPDGSRYGKVCLDYFEPTDLFYEAGSRNVSESSWVARRKRVSRTLLKEQFPDLADKIDEAATQDSSSQGVLGSLFSLFGGKKSAEMAERLNVYYVYDADSSEYGIFLEPDIWLWKGENPEGFRGIHHVVYTPMLGSPFGKGLIQDLIGPMAAYNLRRKQGMDYISLVNQPKVLAPLEGNITPFNDRAGQTITYKLGYEPKYMNLSSWPAGAENDLERFLGEMNSIAGMQNTSLGKREGGVTSGVAIRSLAAQDISKLTATINHTERVFSRVFRDALLLFKNRLTETQAVRMFDTYGSTIYASLDATRLYDDPEVRIDAGSMFVLTRKDLESQTMGQLEAGLISPEEAKERLSINSGRKEALKHMQALNEARGVLDVIMHAPEIDPVSGLPFHINLKIYRTDPLGAFAEVFKEAMDDTQNFADLPEDRQQMIEDIFLCVTNPDATLDAKSMAAQIVYPPMGQGLGQTVAAVSSPQTQAAAVGAEEEMAELGNLADAVNTASQPFSQMGTAPLPVDDMAEGSAPVLGME